MGVETVCQGFPSAETALTLKRTVAYGRTLGCRVLHGFGEEYNGLPTESEQGGPRDFRG